MEYLLMILFKNLMTERSSSLKKFKQTKAISNSYISLYKWTLISYYFSFTYFRAILTKWSFFKSIFSFLIILSNYTNSI